MLCVIGSDYLNSLARKPPAILVPIPPDRALLAKVDAWLNLSHLENAPVLVIVRIRAIASNWRQCHEITPWCQVWNKKGSLISLNSPTRLSQITFWSLTSARIARPIHRAGVAYRLSQKNLLSVALMTRVFGSELSKTQCDSPFDALTSFHQRSPTSRRPAIFFR